MRRIKKGTELRIDPSDGNAYTKVEFVTCYGGLDEWDDAIPVETTTKKEEDEDDDDDMEEEKDNDNVTNAAPPPPSSSSSRSASTKIRDTMVVIGRKKR